MFRLQTISMQYAEKFHYVRSWRVLLCVWWLLRFALKSALTIEMQYGKYD